MVATMRIYQRDLHSQYVDPMCAFTQDHVSKGFKDIFQNTYEHV